MNEELTNVSGTEMSGADNDYLAAIQELKNNTVSKELFNKVKNENKRLLDAYVNGQAIESPVQKKSIEEQAKYISDLRVQLLDPDIQRSNLDHAKLSLELRNAMIEAGMEDSYLPIGKRINPTAEDMEAAQRVADVLEQCIEYADGNSEVFTNELMRRTTEAMPMSRARVKR